MLIACGRVERDLPALARVIAAVMKHHNQKQVGKERAYLAYTFSSLSTIKGSQDRNSTMAGTWWQELMQRPQRGCLLARVTTEAAYRLAPHGLLHLPPYRTQNHQPKDSTGLGPLPSLTD